MRPSRRSQTFAVRPYGGRKLRSDSISRHGQLGGWSVSEGAAFRRTKLIPSLRECQVRCSRQRVSRPGKIIFDDVDLSRVLFHNCDVSEVWFTSSARWAKRGSHGDAVFEEFIPLDQKHAQGLRRDGGRDYRAVAHSIAVEEELRYAVGLLDSERVSLRRDGDEALATPYGRRLLGLRRWAHCWLSLTAWYCYASDYGNSYRKPVVWLLAVLVLFAGLFPLPGVGLRHSAASLSGKRNIWFRVAAWEFCETKPPGGGQARG